MNRIAIVELDRERYWVEIWDAYGQAIAGAVLRFDQVDGFVEQMEATIVSDARENNDGLS